MNYSKLSRYFLPGDKSTRRALPTGLVALIALAAADFSLGEDYRLHSLYLFPFAYIAIHCARPGMAVFAGAVTFGLQSTVLLQYPIPLHTKLVSLLVSLSVVCLTGGLARSLRNTLRTTYHNATHDTLTGLHNRRSFDDLLAMEISRQKRFGSCFSLLLLDLDRFKELNDTHGHAAGDHALRLTAEALKRCTRESDMAARLGGDEFIVLLPNASQVDCATIVAHIAQRIREAMATAGYTITASMGTKTFDTQPDSAENALRQVDDALYAAKAGGRNLCVNR
jgi:diguanylate cyclase (GGDEF)-like protein